MKKSRFTKSYVKWGILIVAVLILLLVPMLRGSQVGSEAYLNQRLAEDFSFYDELSFEGRVSTYSLGTPLILSIAPGILTWILPLVLGILSLIFLRRILNKFTDSLLLSNLVLAIFVLSPAFIYTFSSTNSIFISIFLAILAFYIFIKGNRDWLSLVLIIILPFFSLIITIGLLFILGLYIGFYERKKKKLFFYLLGVGIFSSLLYYVLMMIFAGVPNYFNLAILQKEFWEIFIYDLGSKFGLSLFILVLASFGAIKNWKEKYTKPFVFFSILFLLIYSLLWIEAVLLLNIFAVFLAGVGLKELFERRWSRAKFKDLMIIVIFCGLVFSMISQTNALIEGEPSPEILDGLEFLEQLESGVVFSEQSRGIWINSAGHANVIDDNYQFIHDYEERLNDSQILFYSRDLEISQEIFNKYNIEYVWIDSGFKEEIWEYESEGLLFILEYTKDFKRLYNKGGVEIWRIQND